MQNLGLVGQQRLVEAVRDYARKGKNQAHIMRAAAIPTAFVNSCIPLVAIVATVGEAIIKGFGNIICSIRDKNSAAAWKGVKQLVVQAPLNLLLMTPCTALRALVQFAVDSVDGLINPVNCNARLLDMIASNQLALRNATDDSIAKLCPTILHASASLLDNATIKERIQQMNSSPEMAVQCLKEEIHWLCLG